MEATTEPNTERETNAQHIVNPANTEERIQAIRAVAGRRKGDPSATAWMQEIEKYREQIRQEEIARQEADNQKA